jgi:hypothetical protein
MLVGGTNSGKTVTFEILKHAMTNLKKKVNKINLGINIAKILDNTNLHIES